MIFSARDYPGHGGLESLWRRLVCWRFLCGLGNCFVSEFAFIGLDAAQRLEQKRMLFVCMFKIAILSYIVLLVFGCRFFECVSHFGALFTLFKDGL